MGILDRLRPLLKTGMRRRLILLLGLAAAGLALDSYIDIIDNRDRHVGEVRERMRIVAQNAAAQQTEFAESARLLLSVVTKLAPDLDVCGAGFKDLAASSNWLKAISVADKNGILSCSTGPM
jgi:hypothetical protein